MPNLINLMLLIHASIPFISCINLTYEHSRINVYKKKYMFAPNLLIRSTVFGSERITLSITCSSHYINPSFQESIDNWDGPINLGILIDDKGLISNQAACTYCTLTNLRRYQGKLSATFIYHLTKDKTTFGQLKRHLQNLDCEDSELIMDVCKKPRMTSHNRYIKALSFPINTLRNIGKKMVTTDYLIMTDLDHRYSQNFEFKMTQLAKRYLKPGFKNVLVFRFFELDSRYKFVLRNKQDLQKAMKKKMAIVFHSKKFAKGHAIEKLKSWLKSEETGMPSIQFDKQYYNLIRPWEPQIVTRNDVIDFDERFVYPYRNNYSHRQELCRAQFHFLVVNDCFVYHKGYKTKRDQNIFDGAIRIFRRKKQSIVDIAFRRKLNRLYPLTRGKCGH